jgi:hypothetical protein
MTSVPDQARAARRSVQHDAGQAAHAASMGAIAGTLWSQLLMLLKIYLVSNAIGAGTILSFATCRAHCAVRSTGDPIMKSLTAAMLVAAATALAGGPVSAATIACSELDMSQLTTMVGGMADGANKWQMYSYLAAINTATARNGARGCDVALMNMTRGSKAAKLGT